MGVSLAVPVGERLLNRIRSESAPIAALPEAVLEPQTGIRRKE
jgi:hypothetical protein